MGEMEAIFEDKANNVWITTSIGVSRLSEARIQTFGSDPGRRSHSIWSVTEDRGGDIWLAGGRDLTRLHQRETTRYGAKDGLNGNVTVIFGDASGAVWIGADNGLIRYRDGRPADLRRYCPGVEK